MFYQWLCAILGGLDFCDRHPSLYDEKSRDLIFFKQDPQQFVTLTKLGRSWSVGGWATPNLVLCRHTELVLDSFLQFADGQRRPGDSIWSRSHPRVVSHGPHLHMVVSDRAVSVILRRSPFQGHLVLVMVGDFGGTRLARFVERILRDNGASRFRWFPDTGLIFSTDTELIGVVFNQVLQVKPTGRDRGPVDLDPAGGVRLLALDVVPGDRCATVELRSLPGECTGRLRKVLDLQLTWRPWWSCK